MTLLAKVRQTVEKFGLLARGDRVVIAVSGGPDSVALLQLLVDLRVALGLALHVAHLNHRLRPEAGEDERFVREMAAALGTPVTVHSADVRALAAAQRWSLEEAGRQARYAFFERVVTEVGAQRVATGHTRDDQVETVAMRLLQGSSWETLAGIPRARPLGRAVVVRPLLEITHAELEGYLRERGIAWRDDVTNRDRRMLRNWVRWTLLPALESTRPQTGILVSQMGEVMRAGEQFLSGLAQQALGHLKGQDRDGVRLALDAFRSLPPVLQRRIVRLAVQEVAGTNRPLPGVVEDRAVRLFASGHPGDQVDLGIAVARRDYDALEFVPPQPAPPQREYRLSVPGEVAADAFRLVVSAEVLDRSAAPDPAISRPDEVYLDATAVGSELRVRPWRKGDRFTPLGLRGRKKVHDFFVDEKVPRWERARIPLIGDAHGRILWVVGRRIAEPGRVTARTEQVVRVRIRPVDAAQGTPA